MEGIATSLLTFKENPPLGIEVVDLVWKGLRQAFPVTNTIGSFPIEVVDLVWKGLRHFCRGVNAPTNLALKSLTWFGRDCDTVGLDTEVAHLPH